MVDQAARVAKGAKFLDKKVPDWAEKIKKKKLKMDTNNLCILGQLNDGEGDAFAFASSLKLTDKQMDAYGFETDEDPLGLAACWKVEIDKRTDAVLGTPAPKEAPKKKAKKKEE